MSEPIDTERLTKVFVKIRDKRAELKRLFDEEDSKLKEQQETLSAVMLKHLMDTKSDSVRTAAGTFYREERMMPSATNWDAFYEFIAENNAFDALERRIKKEFVKEYMEANDGTLPPGVAVHREFAVKVRRNK